MADSTGTSTDSPCVNAMGGGPSVVTVGARVPAVVDGAEGAGDVVRSIGKGCSGFVRGEEEGENASMGGGGSIDANSTLKEGVVEGQGILVLAGVPVGKREGLAPLGPDRGKVGVEQGHGPPGPPWLRVVGSGPPELAPERVAVLGIVKEEAPLCPTGPDGLAQGQGPPPPEL